MARLYLIRHGKPAAVWDDDDPGLDETGRAQARAARDWLMALPPAERPTRVVSSPLRRCRETADPTAQALGVTVEVDARVGEIPTPSGLATEDRVVTTDGSEIPLRMDTICVHGDTPGALELARAVRSALERAGVTFASFAGPTP